MADTQLLPCPFCGGTDLSIETNSVQPDDFHDAWVNCGECNADGRHAMTLEGWLPSKAEAKEEAVVAWNRRAALASRPAEVDGSPVDQACARVRRAEAELKAARKALMDVMTTAARTDE